MPWLWALTGNSLLDGHECVVGQISQLHLTASERGRPSLSLQLWKVSYLRKIPLTCPPPAPSRPISSGRHGEVVASGRVLLAGLPFWHSGRVSPSSAAPASTQGWVFLVFFFPEEEFSVGLEVHFPLCACLCTCICEPRESE